MRLDHFSVVGIMLVKCKIQHFTNHWLSVNQAWRRQYRFIVISKRRTDIRPLGNRHRSNIRPMFLCYSGTLLEFSQKDFIVKIFIYNKQKFHKYIYILYIIDKIFVNKQKIIKLSQLNFGSIYIIYYIYIYYTHIYIYIYYS